MCMRQLVLSINSLSNAIVLTKVSIHFQAAANDIDQGPAGVPLEYSGPNSDDSKAQVIESAAGCSAEVLGQFRTIVVHG